MAVEIQKAALCRGIREVKERLGVREWRPEGLIRRVTSKAEAPSYLINQAA